MLQGRWLNTQDTTGEQTVGGVARAPPAAAGQSAYFRSPAATRSATSLSAAAQSEDVFAFLPFAERVALTLALPSAFLARFSSLRACFGGLVAACSTNLVA